MVMYDSPYHGDYAFDGDVWISDDGGRLFARSGNVFRSSSVQSEDMLYAGALTGVSWARWVEHSGTVERVLAFDSPGWGEHLAQELRVYDSAFLAFLGTIRLPLFAGAGTTHAPDGRFVFADADGLSFHALIRADPASGLAADWAVATMPGDAMP